MSVEGIPGALSDHIKRYGNASDEYLSNMIHGIKQSFVEGKTLSKEAEIWLHDFASSMAELIKISRSEVKALKVERDNLCKKVEVSELRSSSPLRLDELDLNETVLQGANENTLNLPNVQQINLTRLVKKPRYFNGSYPMPREWIEEYKDAMEDNFWTEQTGIYYFKHFLVDDAGIWFKLSVRPRIRSNWSWNDLYELFEDNYLGRAEEDRVRAILRGMSMSEQDRAANFIPRVRRHLLLINPKMAEIDQVNQIVEKLRPEYASAIVEHDPHTIDVLRDICRKVEAARDLRKSAIGRSKNEERKIKEPFQRKNVSPSARNSPKQTKEKSCFRCGRNNHLIKECRAKTKLDGSTIVTTENKNYKPNTSNRVNVVVEEEQEEESEEEVTVICNAIIAATSIKDNNMWIEIECNKVRCHALIDSGAGKSVMSEEFARSKNWKIAKDKVIKLSGANLTPIKVVGSIVLDSKLTVGGITKRKKHRWLVTEKLAYPMIMGSDLIVEFDIIADQRRKRIQFHADSGFRAVTDVIIAPRSRQVINTLVAYDGLLLTVNFTRDDKLIVANAITPADRYQAKILVCNPTLEDIKVKAYTKFAGVELIEETSNNDSGKVTPISTMIELPGSKETIKVGSNLSTKQLAELQNLIVDKAEAFSMNGEIGCAALVRHNIELIDKAKPVAEAARRRPRIHIEETAKQVKEMLSKGIIKESQSPWAAAYVVVRKKNGEYRICIDFRRLNSLTIKNAYPLPNIENCLDALAGKRYFSSFDMCSGYWQMELEEEARALTGFRTETGHYEFVRMPFGLCNAPASFQKLMNSLFTGIEGLELQVYLDDVCIASAEWKEHLDMLEKFLDVVISSNLKLQAKKCTLAAEAIKFLGHIVSCRGIQQDPEKMAAIEQIPRPNNLTELRRLIGLLSYYRKFCPRFAELCTPLTSLTKKGVEFIWKDEQERALRELINMLKQNATLAHFDPKCQTLVKTDASKNGLAGILMQKHGEVWKMIACCSRKLNNAESNYGITDMEALAVVYATQKFRPYVLGRHFTLLTDHSALSVFEKHAPTSPRLQRWAILLSELDFEVKYIKGSSNTDVDCLSRAPVADENDNILDEKLCIIVPVDCESWSEYADEESLQLLDQADKRENELELRNNIIYKNNKLYIPSNKRDEIMKDAHDAARGGHGGIRVTLAKLLFCWWPSLIRDVTEYVKGCKECQERKAERALPVGNLQPFKCCEPYHTISIDTVGPLPESLNGKKYIIVAVDIFTRFVEARAIEDVKAEACSDFLLELFGRYGPPKIIITDNGPQFLNDLVSHTLQAFGIQQKWSTADHSQGNSPAERTIQTLTDKLSLNCLSQRMMDSWDSILPVTVLAMNTSVSATTGYEPFEMVFGRTCNLLDNHISRSCNPKDLHTRLLKESLDKIYSRAVENQSVAKENSARQFANNHRIREYELNDLVMMRDPNRRKGKLDPRFLGPFKVIGKENSIYTIEEVGGNKKIVQRHTESLRPYRVRDNTGRSPRQNDNQREIRRPRRARSSHGENSPEAGPSRVGIILALMCLLNMVCPMMAVFNREPSVMWVWQDRSVYGRTVYYDIMVITKDPCDSLQPETDKYVHSKIEAHYDSGQKSEILNLHESMLNRCRDMFMKIWDKSVYEFSQTCKNFNREQIDEIGGDIIQKRGFVTNTLSNIVGGFSGALVMDLVSTVWAYINPNSDYNRLNRVEAKVDSISAKHAAELNAFKAVSKLNIKLMNGTVHAVLNNTANLQKLTTDLPSYIFGAAYIMDHIEHGARILDRLAATCHDTVDIAALAELLNLHELNHVKAVDSRWVSVTSDKSGQLRLVFKVVIPSKDTHVIRAEAFDVWNVKTKTLIRYDGALDLMYNSSAHCAIPIDLPVSHIVTVRCARQNSMSPELKKWKPLRVVKYFSEVEQKTTVKDAGLTQWVYCFPGWVKIEERNMSCPSFVFSVPSNVPFETSDYTHSPERMFLENGRNMHLAFRFGAELTHFETDSFNLLDAYEDLQRSANATTPALGPIGSNPGIQYGLIFCCTLLIPAIIGLAVLWRMLKRIREAPIEMEIKGGKDTNKEEVLSINDIVSNMTQD